MFAYIKSIASYVPNKVLSNKDIEKFLDTSDEWIQKRTGIKERRIAETEDTSDLGVKAANLAIKRANINKEDIECIICATISPDYFSMPSTACLIAEKLGIKSNITAFDISAACTGFIYLLQLAKSFVESNKFKNVLIIGAEKMSKLLDYTDRGTCIIFGDGAGAAIISSSSNKDSLIIDVNTHSDGSQKELLKTPIPKKNEDICMYMKGNETFKIAVKRLSQSAKDILEVNNIDIKNLKFFIPHQANYRILKAVAENIGLDYERAVVTVDKYANTSSASIPMAMNDIYEKDLLKRGDLLLLNAFGGGLTWGSALIKF